MTDEKVDSTVSSVGDGREGDGGQNVPTCCSCCAYADATTPCPPRWEKVPVWDDFPVETVRVPALCMQWGEDSDPAVMKVAVLEDDGCWKAVRHEPEDNVWIPVTHLFDELWLEMRRLPLPGREEDSNLLAHARRELQAVGYDLDQKEEDPNKWICESLLELLTTFTYQGHSGFSAGYCVEAFKKLAMFEPLCPLTGADDEWVEVSEGLWQNNRCSHVFKDADGRAYDIDGRVFRDPDGCHYTNRDSRVYVEFPYTPKTEYVDAPERD